MTRNDLEDQKPYVLNSPEMSWAFFYAGVVASQILACRAVSDESVDIVVMRATK